MFIPDRVILCPACYSGATYFCSARINYEIETGRYVNCVEFNNYVLRLEQYEKFATYQANQDTESLKAELERELEENRKQFEEMQAELEKERMMLDTRDAEDNLAETEPEPEETEPTEEVIEPEKESAAPLSEEEVINRSPGGRKLKKDASVKYPARVGRQRANLVKPIKPGDICEWSMLKSAGGGVVPIIGCYNNPASTVHHGPDKDYFNNTVENLHKICKFCHAAYHTANDPFYVDKRPPAGTPFYFQEEVISLVKPHDPNTKATLSEVFDVIAKREKDEELQAAVLDAEIQEIKDAGTTRISGDDDETFDSV